CSTYAQAKYAFSGKNGANAFFTTARPGNGTCPRYSTWKNGADAYAAFSSYAIVIDSYAVISNAFTCTVVSIISTLTFRYAWRTGNPGGDCSAWNVCRGPTRSEEH